MINVFDYLYYKLFNYSMLIHAKSRAIGNASALMGLFLSLNVTFLICSLTKVDFKWTFVVSFILLGIILNKIHNQHTTEKITNKYSHESQKQKLIGRFAVIAYVIASIVSAGIVLWHSFD